MSTDWVPNLSLHSFMFDREVELFIKAVGTPDEKFLLETVAKRHVMIGETIKKLSDQIAKPEQDPLTSVIHLAFWWLIGAFTDKTAFDKAVLALGCSKISYENHHEHGFDSPLTSVSLNIMFHGKPMTAIAMWTAAQIERYQEILRSVKREAVI